MIKKGCFDRRDSFFVSLLGLVVVWLWVPVKQLYGICGYHGYCRLQILNPREKLQMTNSVLASSCCSLEGSSYCIHAYLRGNGHG